MTTSKQPPLLARQEGATATLTLNRPSKRNAMSDEMLRLFSAELEHAISEDAVRTIVVTGAGPCFSAGRDTKDLGTPDSACASMEDESLDRTVNVFTDALRRLITSPKPTIAAVRGFAFGGGQAMSLACDFLVAERPARFGNVEIAYGFPAALNTVLLARHLGRRRAMEVAMTGDVYSAEAWHAFGLVNRLAEPGKLEAEVAAFAGLLNEREPWAIKRTKGLLQAAEEVPLEVGLMLGGQLNQLLRLNSNTSSLYRDAGGTRTRIQEVVRKQD